MSAVAVRAPPDAAMGWAAKGDRDGLAALLKSRGYNIHGFHPSCLAVVRHRIQQRLAVLGYAAAGGCEAAGGGEAAAGAEAAPVAAYAAIAAGDEARELDAMLRINYTQWNRNHIFDFLQAQVFRRVAGVARDNGDAVCRAWCAGCSTGQEPFALVGYWDRWARRGRIRPLACRRPRRRTPAQRSRPWCGARPCTTPDPAPSESGGV